MALVLYALPVAWALASVPGARADGSPLGIAVDAHHIYWVNAQSTAIGRANLDGTGITQGFILGASIPRDVAVDANHIYWTNGTSSGTIGRANLDGSGIDQSFIDLATYVDGLAVDPAHIYWTVSGVNRANLDGSGVNLGFITSGTPVGVAVDAGHVYWTGWPLDPSDPWIIGRANLDGTAVNQGFITGVSSPTYGGRGVARNPGLAVDAQYIYWTNPSHPGSGTIGRAKLDGSGINQSFITGAVTPAGVAVDQDHIYWTNGSGTIGRANLDGTGVDQSFISGLDTGIKGGFGANKTQRRGLGDIYVKVKLTAKEKLSGHVKGKIVLSINESSLQLKPRNAGVPAGGAKVLKLRLKKTGAERKAADALARGRKITAQVNVKFTDKLGHTESKKVSAKLVRD